MKFDRDVPIPPREGTRNVYSLGQMLKGDSFFIPGRSIHHFSAHTSYQKRNAGYQFTARTMTENGVKGVRVWCLQSPTLESLTRKVHLIK